MGKVLKLEPVLEDTPQQAHLPELPDGGDVRRALGEVKWLWEGWLPRGYLVALAADPGVGKSAIALHLAGVASGHFPSWPDGCRTGKGWPVLWAEAEGGLSLHAARMRDFDLPDSAIRFFPSIRREPVEVEGFRLDDLGHVARLAHYVEQYAPGLIVVDALRAAHGGAENSSSITSLLAPLVQLAQEQTTTVLLIHHLRKVRPGPRGMPRVPSLDDLRESSALGAAPRVVLMACRPDPARPGEGRLWVEKMNIATKPPALGFAWEGKRLVFTDQAPTAPAPGRKADATTVLLEELADGKEHQKSLVVVAMADAGFNESAINRAARRLEDARRIVRTRRGVDGRTLAFWRLS
jgi:hypothetical protein